MIDVLLGSAAAAALAYGQWHLLTGRKERLETEPRSTQTSRAVGEAESQSTLNLEEMKHLHDDKAGEPVKYQAESLVKVAEQVQVLMRRLPSERLEDMESELVRRFLKDFRPYDPLHFSRRFSYYRYFFGTGSEVHITLPSAALLLYYTHFAYSTPNEEALRIALRKVVERLGSRLVESQVKLTLREAQAWAALGWGADKPEE